MQDEEPSLPEAPDASAAKPGIGDTLRATREFRRASIEYVAELLRLEPRVIAALEEERFDEIGPPVFVKGYLKHYCELLGIDPAPVLDELRARLAREEPPLQPRRSAERGGERSRLPTIGIVGAVVALAAVAVWRFGGLGFGTAERAEPDDQAADVRTLPTDRPQTSSVPAAPTGRRGIPGGEPGGSAAEAGRIAPGAGEGGPVPPAVSEITPGLAAAGEDASAPAAVGGALPQAGAATPGGALDETPTAALAAASTGTGTARTAAVSESSGSVPIVRQSLTEINSSAFEGEELSPSDPAAADARLEIELRFVEDSWTEVTGPDGERLFYGLGRAGSEERIRAGGQVRVLLGNADGVRVSVNGAPFAYPAGSRNGNLARFRVSPEDN